MRRLIAMTLTLCLLLALGCPGALAAGRSATARTPLAGASDAKLNNIGLAVAALNGLRVADGESFSFNSAVGPRTQGRGYRSALNGRGVSVTGGGVSQVATTLYLALLDLGADVRFDSLSTYGQRFADSYVSDGSLAVITDYSAGTDFRFTNLAGDMRLSLWTDASWLYCTVTLDGGAAGADSWFVDWGDGGQTGAPATPLAGSASLRMGGESGVVNNVALAAGSVYDTTLASGDLFSFNRVVGPRTGKYGYVSGTNGRGVKVMGGGVAQVASVIWLAIKDMDDVAVVEKATYGGRYNQSYVASSADAIVTDYKEDIDFSFRYTGPGSITIYTYTEGDTLRCDVVRNGGGYE